ncbi:YbxH family protein [Bacillus sp. CLL-7-23]|uniref:YbxH family protein n=1 Tax=Bacillus changyiensis TaxID=3004103 RepID=A0ABT4X7V5_9BACI|nr:YbxH family protein [Bacillus changyiensis]MDA7028351.1 YbxH family protein [Bacillus changyiensis]
MGAIERNGYTFEPEYSVTRRNGAIHVYRRGQFVEEIRFDFEGEFPEHDLIEELVNHYCYENKI